jgi:hypothetical protein
MTNPRGGAEIFYSYDHPADYLTVKLVTNIKGVAQFQDPVFHGFKLVDLAFWTLEMDSETHVTCQVWLDGVLTDQSEFNLHCGLVESIHNRVVFSDTSISVYTNDLWVYTYCFVDTDWPGTVQIKAQVTGGDVTLNVVRAELCDPREAVYIDYESTSDSALQSIIQQRPIQVFAQVDRANSFTYSATRDRVSSHHVITYEDQTRDNNNMASDGLVYYSDVGINISELTAEQVGLITKLYRLSELYNGAIEAAKRMQQIALERRKIVTVTCRLDSRLQIADILVIDTILTGTGTHITDEIIIEDITISLSDGSYSMRISGRRKL